MGTLIVIEGLDGSGKNTLSGTLTGHWRAGGRSVATLAFPRYGADVHADLVRDMLYGRLGDLTDSVYGSALLFSLDRRAAADQIRELQAGHDIVLLDRYISSNAAYGAARLGGPDVDTGFPEWVRALEVDRFGIPVPDHQLLLATPPELAERRARDRAARHEHRALDTFEADGDLQRRTAAMYRSLAAADYLSRWTVLEPGEQGTVAVPDEVLQLR
ncbi:MAG TPA: dTMP kinase [Nakamurella sp.]|nr:dTMP kinase [Nakamurella sp.]